jgi:hypothetical protein
MQEGTMPKEINSSQKSNKRSMAETIRRETKWEGQQKAKGCTTRRNQQKGDN